MDKKTYNKISEARLSMNSLVMKECLIDSGYTKAARALDIFKKGTTVYADEDEMSSHIDLGIREIKTGGKTPVEQAFEEKLYTNKYEYEYLKGMCSSHVSLFEVVEKNEGEGNIVLKDILFPDQGDKTLYDIGFSMTATPGKLLFTVLVPVYDAYISSGISFVFHERQIDIITRECFMRSKNKEIFKDSIQRFKMFFHLNRKFGNMVLYR